MTRDFFGVSFSEHEPTDDRPERFYWESEGRWARIYPPVDRDRLGRLWLVQVRRRSKREIWKSVLFPGSYTGITEAKKFAARWVGAHLNKKKTQPI